MAIVYFSSLEQGDVLEVVFVKPQGDEVVLSLLVDSGFTGQSCFVLPPSAEELSQAAVTASQAAGALSGTQRRILVTCRIPVLSFDRSVIAILADTSPLALPAGIHGLAGLRFLRQFRRWGAEQCEGGSWRFFLSTDA